jgi:hypothetical protein
MAVVNTGGFQVQARPGIDYVDPRLMAAGYDRIIPALGQGIGVGNNLSQIAEAAQMRPMRRRLAEISVQQAEADLANTPLKQRQLLAQIANAEQNAAIPTIIPGTSFIEDQTRLYPAALDEDGRPTGEGERVIGDLIQITDEDVYGPGGTKTTRQVRKTLKTAADREAEAAKQAVSLESARALATQRNRGKQFEAVELAQLYDEALASGDGELAALYKSRLDRLNTQPNRIESGDTYEREMEKTAARAGVPIALARELAKTPEGAQALAAQAAANMASAKNEILPPTVSARQRQLLAGDELEAELGDLLGAPAATPAVPAFNSIQEAEAAGRNGLLKPGQKILVGGKSATWQ